MLKIGRASSQNAASVMPAMSQPTLGDLYQLYAQASRQVGQSVQATWYARASEYVLSVTTDIKLGAIWQLSTKSHTGATCLWSLTTNNVADVHKRLIVDAR